MKINEIIVEGKKSDPCWTGYEQYGMKTKNGKKVPNCVPKEGVAEGSDHSLKKVWDRYSKHLMAARGDHSDIRQINKSGEIVRDIRKYVRDHHGQKAVDDMERYAEKQQWNEGLVEDDAGDVEQRMIAKIEKEKQRLSKLKQTDPEAYKREMAKSKTSSRVPPVSTFEDQGVAEGLSKSIKRAAQGWGVGGAPDMVTPKGVVQAFGNMDGQRLANFVASRKELSTPSKDSARAFADKVIDREMKQRGYGRVVDKDEQGVAEGSNGEYDDEAGMAHTNLHTIARAAKGLLDTIDDNENLPEWVQEKIAKVEGMMTSAWDYLESQEEQGIDPRMSSTKSLSEFAPPGSGGDGDDEFDEETLRQLAAQWWNGDRDPRVEQILAASGWEIGEVEDGDEGGAFVVQSGDEHGRSYIHWPAEELEGLIGDDDDGSEETYHDDDQFFEAYGVMEYTDHVLSEAEYHGRKVTLNKPMQGDVKKFRVYVKDPKTGNIKKVNFGQKGAKIKKSNPARRKSFRARHNCANPGPKTGARYWSCRKW
jgi:hypothetical protein